MKSFIRFLKFPTSTNAHAILGLGPGLTPLGDDILFGHVLAMNALNIVPAYKTKLIKNLRQTNRISSQLLIDVLNKNYNSFYQSFIKDFFLLEKLNNLSDIFNFGATSGTGILTGFIFGIQGVKLYD